MISISELSPFVAFCTLAIFTSIAYLVLSHRTFTRPKIITSPRETLLPVLSPEQASLLPYPPNALPGPRDVESSYGTMRVYEWGPEEGRKVILVPGDSSPAPILGSVAHALTKLGCRVMIIGKSYGSF